MILVLDIGNSQIFGGVIDSKQILVDAKSAANTKNGSPDPRLLLQFRKSSRMGASSDEIGIFLRDVLHENGIDYTSIERIAMCSVVPDLIHSVRGACQKYFAKTPFILQAGTKTGLKIKYRNPLEVGSDRIANAIAATHKYPSKNLIIVDYGTATTFCAITADRDYLGGLIVPGLRLSMESLESGTAKLPKVEILHPAELVGRSTVESIQSGLYFGNLAIVREISRQIRETSFVQGDTLLIGTGGFSRLFEKEKVFDVFEPDLVLWGLYRALWMNDG